MPRGKLQAFYLTAKSLCFKNRSKTDRLLHRRWGTVKPCNLCLATHVTESPFIDHALQPHSFRCFKQRLRTFSVTQRRHSFQNKWTDWPVYEQVSRTATHHFPPLVEVACHSHCVVFLPRHFDGLFLACHIAGHLLRVLASDCPQCPATCGRDPVFSLSPFLSWYVLGNCGSSYDASFIFEKAVT